MSYIVTDLGPVNHDGEILLEGNTISSLTEEQAAHLLKIGVIANAAANAAANAPAKPSAKPAKGGED